MNNWKRRGLHYYAEFVEPAQHPMLKRITITRSLGFISYHLIRLIHGEEKLERMRTRPSQLSFEFVDLGKRRK